MCFIGISWKIAKWQQVATLISLTTNIIREEQAYLQASPAIVGLENIGTGLHANCCFLLLLPWQQQCKHVWGFSGVVWVWSSGEVWENGKGRAWELWTSGEEIKVEMGVHQGSVLGPLLIRCGGRQADGWGQTPMCHERSEGRLREVEECPGMQPRQDRTQVEACSKEAQGWEYWIRKNKPQINVSLTLKREWIFFFWVLVVADWY